MMTLTQKEQGLIKDLIGQEQLCVEKYAKAANAANAGVLKNLFTQVGGQENEHLKTLQSIQSGTVPENGGASTGNFSVCSTNQDEAAKAQDQYLCTDLLSTEKHVSSLYDTCIFEFGNPDVRNTLNRIQKEEQHHGEMIWQYMSQNGMQA